jgi:molybdopterin-containing oxidoreductase family iron-sulfur binding subunit
MSEFWRNLEEFADGPEFRRFIEREYPSQAEIALDPLSRRRFLQLMGASLALAGAAGCSRAPAETIVPYVRQPEEIVPGKPLFFATAMPLGGFGTGVLVESHMGRPTKVEGNPNHPASLGASDIFAQASILDLYNPDRAQVVNYRGRIRPWNDLVSALREALERDKPNRGAGLRVLTGTVTSPTLADQLRALLNQYPAAKWHQYEPAGRHHTRAGALLALGKYAQTQYRFDKADIVVAFDGEALSCGPGHLRYGRELAQRRKPAASMSRIYAVESTPSTVGALADHRLALAPKALENFVTGLGARLGLGGPASAPPGQAQERWLAALAEDLKQHRGTSVIVAGESMAPAIHAWVHVINSALGNIGQTVFYSDPAEANPVDEIASLRELSEDMERGAVSTLIIIEGDPVYDAPADFDIGERLGKVPLRIHLALEANQTSQLCHWQIPAAHYLETWSDVRAYDGTVTILQPLIAPLYGGKTAHDVVAALSADPQRSSHEIVRSYWQKQIGKAPADFERWWRKSLHDGVVENTAFAHNSLTPRVGAIDNSRIARIDSNPAGSDGRPAAGNALEDGSSMQLLLCPDPNLFDGRFANNAWLQELPKPLTKISWDNAALIAPATAKRLGLTGSERYSGGTTSTELVELRLGARSVRAPVWIVPGQAENTVALHLGYGRSRIGRVGTGVGVNAYRLRDSHSLWSASALEIRRTGEPYELASSQLHHTMAGRDIVRATTQTELQQQKKTAPGEEAAPPSLYPEYKYDGHAWGLSIDLNACIGCNACVVACQSENNIPVVGKSQVLRSREMHWLRIDTYYKGEPDNPETYVQPVPCMHCENAPCEVVCPVAATAHSAEGLNDMVYNRCVGTRYCSNNCPYKVRRFNFLQFSDWNTESLKAMRNPDVTVRSRGVMEKCTYCVQRINHAKIAAEKENRPVRDGEIVTACQQACPAEAIVFGDLNDASSKVAALKTDPRNYSLLEELNTRPRTTYLAAVRNPNPALKKGSGSI